MAHKSGQVVVEFDDFPDGQPAECTCQGAVAHQPPVDFGRGVEPLRQDESEVVVVHHDRELDQESYKEKIPAGFEHLPEGLKKVLLCEAIENFATNDCLRCCSILILF